MIDLDELLSLHEAATPGPWQYLPDYEAVYGPEPTDEQKKAGTERREVVGPVLLAVIEDCYLGAETGALIVAARNALPELIKRVREAESGRLQVMRTGRELVEKCRHRAEAAEARVLRLEEQANKLADGQNEYREKLVAAESRVAHLESGIKAKADEWFRMSVHEGKTLITTSEAHRQLFALRNGTDKDGA